MARSGVAFDVLGLGGFQGDLDAIRDSVRAELIDVCDDTARGIQYRARVLVRRRRGDLAGAIQIAGKGLTRSVGLDDRSIPSRGGTNTAHLNPWVYGLWVEQGLKHRRMEPQPYMGPSADAEEPQHQARVEAALNRGIA